MSEEAKNLVSGMIDRARKAMDQIADYSQEEIDELCNKVAAAAANEEDAQEIAELAVEETKMGVVEHKRVKITKKVKGTWNDIKEALRYLVWVTQMAYININGNVEFKYSLKLA